jgi:hypothetical protein
MKTISGWLYGHYDSRGGATFIAAPSKAEADEWYCNDFALEEIWKGDELKEAKASLIEEDFMGPATLQSPVEIKNGEDIEYRDEKDPLKLWNQMKVESDPHYSLVIAKEPPDETYEESELGEDAFGVIFQDKKEW